MQKRRKNRPQTDPEVDLPIADLIKNAAQQAGGYLNLQYMIAEDVNEPTSSRPNPMSIDRRKLRRIAERDFEVPLRLEELRLLDKFFVRRGYSLATHSLFKYKGIIEQINESKTVVILSAAYPDRRTIGKEDRDLLRTDLDHWDVKSIGEIIRIMNEHNIHPNISLENALFRDPGSDIELHDEPWIRFFKGDTDSIGPGSQSSVIAVGSPRANRSASYMLERIFNRRHEKPEARLEDRLPFYFVWRPDARHRASSFVIDHMAGPVPRLDRSFAGRLEHDDAARGLYLTKRGRREERLYKADTEGGKGRSYGIIAAQLQAPGTVWIAVAGITAPATFGIASLLGQLRTPIPMRPDAYWAALEIDLRIDESASRGDPHLVEDARILFESTQDREA